MHSDPVFSITYWGITGTMTTPLTPAEVTNRLVGAIEQLVKQGRLANLRSGPDLSRTIRRHMEEGLSFAQRSTFGGNTTCVEVQTPDKLLILDCGSGMRELGFELSRRWNRADYTGSRAAHVLITHAHMDHTYATPYVSPYFDSRNHFTLYGTRSVLDSLEAVLSPDSPLSHTYFPPTFDLMKAVKDFRELQSNDRFSIGSTRVRTYALHHPGGCLAYRLENNGQVFVFATDHEHQEVPDANLAAFAQGADLFYTEGQYLAAEYEGRQAIPGDPPLPRRGWGHSSVEACVATAIAAGVRELHLGHREPRRNDAQLQEIEQFAQQLMRQELRRAGRQPDECRVRIPYEGLTVRL